MKRMHRLVPPARIPGRRPGGWFCLLAVLGAAVFGGTPGARAQSTPALDVAADRVASALAEGVEIALREAPQDERGLVMIVTGIDDDLIKAIQQSPAASPDFVDKVARRYRLSTGTRRYIAGALIGLSQICEDFPPPSRSAIDPNLLKLIVAFRRGVNAGVERHHSSGTGQAG